MKELRTQKAGVKIEKRLGKQKRTQIHTKIQVRIKYKELKNYEAGKKKQEYEK